MKKIIVLLLPFLILSVLYSIPVKQQKTVLIKSSFFNVYGELANPANWKKWRLDLNKAYLADSGKISIKKEKSSFTINFAGEQLNVKSSGTLFNISDKWVDYSYLVVPDKIWNRTLITVYKNTNALNYLIRALRPASFSDTHITDLKNFMETDSLYYGCRIFKTKVPEENLIVIKKTVLAKNKFTEAAKSLATLKQFLKTNGISQMQPAIAQFLPRGTDSVHVNVGLFINKEVNSDKVITYTHMPKGGPLYVAKYSGKFNDKQKVYAGLRQYFTDHHYQSVILPFETYLDDRLPVSDTDRINIQVNFTAYF
ncbi:MAG TPA: hypothetical protein VIM16_23600 [Mucilaginibacter sp.]|jgi:effector-binding domain-containing protein